MLLHALLVLRGGRNFFVASELSEKKNYCTFSHTFWNPNSLLLFLALVIYVRWGILQLSSHQRDNYFQRILSNFSSNFYSHRQHRYIITGFSPYFRQISSQNLTSKHIFSPYKYSWEATKWSWTLEIYIKVLPKECYQIWLSINGQTIFKKYQHQCFFNSLQNCALWWESDQILYSTCVRNLSFYKECYA